MENTDARDWTGLGVALVTPFQENLQIDEAALSKLVEHCIAGGVDYLVALGTTGESVTLSFEEKKRVVSVVKEANHNRVPLVLGHGGNNTAQLLRELSEYELEGVSALLSASPAYNKPTQEGLLAHYKALSEASPLPIILYNVPGRTASNIEARTAVELARSSSVFLGVKEASGLPLQQLKIVRDAPSSFKLIAGDDISAPATILAGGKGLISVLGQALPIEVGQMVRSALTSHVDEANALHRELIDLIELLFAEGNPAGIKSLLHAKEICQPYVRLPLIQASATLQSKIQRELQRLETVL